MHSYTVSPAQGNKITQTAEAARLLSDPTRLRILSLLFDEPEGMCVYEIADKVGSSPSATSHQLAKLEANEIVICFREGQKMCYQITDTSLVKRIKKILDIFNTSS